MSEQDIKMLKDMLTSIMESQTRTELKLENIEGRLTKVEEELTELKDITADNCYQIINLKNKLK